MTTNKTCIAALYDLTSSNICQKFILKKMSSLMTVWKIGLELVLILEVILYLFKIVFDILLVG